MALLRAAVAVRTASVSGETIQVPGGCWCVCRSVDCVVAVTCQCGVSELEVDEVLLFSAVFQQQEDDGVADKPAGPAGWSAGGEFECVCSTSLNPFGGEECGNENPDVSGDGEA